MIWQTCGTFFHALALRGLDFLLSSCLRLWTLTLPAHGNMFNENAGKKNTPILRSCFSRQFASWLARHLFRLRNSPFIFTFCCGKHFRPTSIQSISVPKRKRDFVEGLDIAFVCRFHFWGRVVCLKYINCFIRDACTVGVLITFWPHHFRHKGPFNCDKIHHPRQSFECNLYFTRLFAVYTYTYRPWYDRSSGCACPFFFSS